MVNKRTRDFNNKKQDEMGYDGVVEALKLVDTAIEETIENEKYTDAEIAEAMDAVDEIVGIKKEQNSEVIETREYKITASKEQLDSLENVFRIINAWGLMNRSGFVDVFVDGNSKSKPKIARTDSKDLSSSESYKTSEHISIDLK